MGERSRTAASVPPAQIAPDHEPEAIGHFGDAHQPALPSTLLCHSVSFVSSPPSLLGTPSLLSRTPAVDPCPRGPHHTRRPHCSPPFSPRASRCLRFPFMGDFNSIPRLLLSPTQSFTRFRALPRYTFCRVPVPTSVAHGPRRACLTVLPPARFLVSDRVISLSIRHLFAYYRIAWCVVYSAPALARLLFVFWVPAVSRQNSESASRIDEAG